MEQNRLDQPFNPEERTPIETIKETYRRVNSLEDKIEKLEGVIMKMEKQLTFVKGVSAAVGFIGGLVGFLIMAVINWFKGG